MLRLCCHVSAVSTVVQWGRGERNVSWLFFKLHVGTLTASFCRPAGLYLKTTHLIWNHIQVPVNLYLNLESLHLLFVLYLLSLHTLICVH